MNVNILRDYFPIFQSSIHKDKLVYLDSASTSQKPKCVIDAITEHLVMNNANVHRAGYQLARNATDAFEYSREAARRFINARDKNEIIWTSGATSAFNLLTQILDPYVFKKRKKIFLSPLEHHSNLVPWQQLLPKYELDFLPIDDNGNIKLSESLDKIDEQTAILSISHASNALGNINPIKALIMKAKECGATTIIDGCQSAPHLTIDVQNLGCDFYVFSGHKLYGPTGLGILYGKSEYLNQLPVYHTGGEMVSSVSLYEAVFQPLPYKYEAGTPNIMAVVALASAIEFVERHRTQINEIETHLYTLLLSELSQIPEITVLGEQRNSVPIVSFTIRDIDNKDAAMMLDEKGVAVRAGHHCAMPLMTRLNLTSSIRASIACYNNEQDIRYFAQVLKEIISYKQNNVSVTMDTLPGNNGLILASSLKKLSDWDQLYRYIQWASKKLKRLPSRQKIAKNEVIGCESQVWLTIEIRDQNLIVNADSPSQMVRGLLAILFEVIESMSINEIADFDPVAYFNSIGLKRYVSDSRVDGIVSVTDKIKNDIDEYRIN